MVVRSPVRRLFHRSSVMAVRQVAFFIPFDSQTVKIEDLNVEHI
jgi:hypothetical protein